MNSYRCQQCGHVLQTDKSPTADRLDCEKCSTPLSDSDMVLERGAVIGGFSIEKIIGQGGMGSVYKAKQTSMGRDVALKVLHGPCTADRKAVLQFINEIRATGQVRHRNIVTAIEAGEADGHYFMAMNYIDGDNLEERLQGGERIEEREALKIGVKIASALDHVWSKLKMAHRDIKPANIVLDKSAEPFLLDLGIAQFHWEEKTSKGKVLGTPYYMSPEQAKAGKLDWRSDLYSLGATLYHLIVGVPPYDNDSVTKIIEAHVLLAFPDPKARNPAAEVSPACVALLKTMMAKDPDDRFASWTDFIRAAEDVINNRKTLPATSARQAEPAAPAKVIRQTAKISPRPRPAASKGFPVFGYVLLFLLLIGGGGGYYLFARQNEAQRSLQTAEDYLKANPQDFPKALELFAQAKDIAQATQFKRIVEERYAVVKQAADKDKVRQERVSGVKRVIAKARELIDKKEYAVAVALLSGYADQAVAQAQNMLDNEDYAAAAKALGDLADLGAPELVKDVATLLAVAKSKLEGEASERLRQTSAAQAEKAEAEAAKLDKEKTLEDKRARQLEQERAFIRGQLDVAFIMALNGKAKVACAKLEGLQASDELKPELELVKVVKIVALADAKIEKLFSGGEGKILKLKLKDSDTPVPMEIRSYKNGSLLVIPEGKGMGVKVKVSDLDTEDLILKTGAENPVTQAVIATFFYLRAGKAAEAADEARNAGPYADALGRFVEGKDKIKDDKKAEKRFLHLLKKCFALNFDSAPLPAEALKAIKGKNPVCEEPWKARESFKEFLLKHQDGNFVKAYGESVKLVKAKLWSLPLAPADLFSAAKVDYDPKTHELTLDYDFAKGKQQLADWPDASFKDGRLYCGSGAPAYCRGVFDKVKITASMRLLDQDAGVIASSAKAGSQLFFKAFGPETSGTPQLLLLDGGKPPLVIAKPKAPKAAASGSATLSIQGNVVRATDGDAKLEKPVRNLTGLTVGVFSDGGSFDCDKVSISGTLDQEWLAAESKKLQQTGD